MMTSLGDITQKLCALADIIVKQGLLAGLIQVAREQHARPSKVNAQQYLDTYYAGTTVGEVTTFYGYYTIEVENNGNIYGMLSVNSYTGQVWFHTWHGSFIQEATIA